MSFGSARGSKKKDTSVPAALPEWAPALAVFWEALREADVKALSSAAETMDWRAVLSNKKEHASFFDYATSYLSSLLTRQMSEAPTAEEKKSQGEARACLEALDAHAPFWAAMGGHLAEMERSREWRLLRSLIVAKSLAADGGPRAQRMLASMAMDALDKVDGLENAQAFRGLLKGEWLRPQQKSEMLGLWARSVSRNANHMASDAPLSALRRWIDAEWVSEADLPGELDDTLLDGRSPHCAKDHPQGGAMIVGALLAKMGEKTATQDSRFEIWREKAAEFARHPDPRVAAAWAPTEGLLVAWEERRALLSTVNEARSAGEQKASRQSASGPTAMEEAGAAQPTGSESRAMRL